MTEIDETYDVVFFKLILSNVVQAPWGSSLHLHPISLCSKHNSSFSLVFHGFNTAETAAGIMFHTHFGRRIPYFAWNKRWRSTHQLLLAEEGWRGQKGKELLFVCVYSLIQTCVLEIWPRALDISCFGTAALFINLPSQAPFINRFWSANKPWEGFNKWFLA